MADKALDLSENMSANRNDVIYMLAFRACAELANEKGLNIAKKLLHQISSEITSNTTLANAALHALMRVSDVEGAEHLFELIQNKDIVSYGAMMQGNCFSYNLHPHEVLFRLS